MIDASLVTAVATLLTNKLYLGWPPQTWDPMLLGALLAIVAVVVRRWLLRGAGGERHGFTPARLLESEADAIRLLGLASVGVRPAHEGSVSATEPSGFRGGRSGGAGGGNAF